MKIVIKLGGSVCIGEAGPDFSYFAKLIPVINEIKSKNQLIISIGGGHLTRSYGKSIERSPLSNDEKEKIFIQLIRANVLFVSSLFKLAPLATVDDIKNNSSGVIGGIVPGRSTDANAALAAQKIDADLFIKLTDVDGIYDKDPKKFRNAKKIDRMSFADLRKFSMPGKPNSYGILDATAIGTLSRAKIKTVVINGKDPALILDVLKGKSIGTTIE